MKDGFVLGIVVHVYNPHIQEAETGES
jgi:hypothetical protein